jgi:uncharacterized protein
MNTSGPSITKREKAELLSEKVERCAVLFESNDETLHGWLYLPRIRPPGSRLPGIVTANAMTGIKEINLPEYARLFAEAGFAAITFDYRYWGESSGEPRYHLAPMEHREDIRSALTFLSDQPEVDPARIGGWGISMGEGTCCSLPPGSRASKPSWQHRLGSILKKKASY